MVIAPHTKLYASGKFVDPMNLRLQDITLEDISHNLSMICRYSGAFPFHYSVAQHSALVCNAMAKDRRPAVEMMAGLLHDASEYLLSDLITQVKHHPTMQPYRDLETRVQNLIFKKYGVDPELLDVVKAYDKAVFQDEMLVRHHASMTIEQKTPTQAKKLFLDCFAALAPYVSIPYA